SDSPLEFLDAVRAQPGELGQLLPGQAGCDAELAQQIAERGSRTCMHLRTLPRSGVARAGTDHHQTPSLPFATAWWNRLIRPLLGKAPQAGGSLVSVASGPAETECH